MIFSHRLNTSRLVLQFWVHTVISLLPIGSFQDSYKIISSSIWFFYFHIKPHFLGIFPRLSASCSRLAQPLVLCFDSYLFLVFDSLFFSSAYLVSSDLFLIPSPITMHIECNIFNYLLIMQILSSYLVT